MTDIRTEPLRGSGSCGNAGNKAAALRMLWNGGIRIPRGYVLTNAFLRELLEANGRSGEFSEICSEPVVINRCRKLKDIIMSLVFPAETLLQAQQVLSELGGSVIVRSSSANEDSADSSMAGMYLSIGGADSVEKLSKAVLECFAAAYSQAILSTTGSFDEDMALIIQEFIPSDCSGIAFTAEPVEHDSSVLVINYGDDVSALTDGSMGGSVLRLDKEAPVLPLDIPYRGCFCELCDMLKRAEGIFGYPLDCEWVFSAGKVWLIQARPVTTVAKHELREIIDLDDISQLNGAELGRLSVANDKWFAKKYYVRRTCIERGIPVYAARYIWVSDDPLQRSRVASLAQGGFKTQLCEAYDGREYTVFRTGEFAQMCETAYRAAGSGYIRVCEYWVADHCGYATVTADSSVYIETVKGSFYGMWVGGLMPSFYEVSPDGAVVRSSENEMPFYYRLSPQTYKYERFDPDKPVLHALSAQELEDINRLCRQLRSGLGDVNIEWLATSDGIRIFDLSEGSTSLVGEDCMANVLSRGQAQGRLVFAQDISALEGLFENVINDIDVVPTEQYRATLESDACRAAVMKITGGHDKPIVVADFPDRALAVLCGDVSGFIFRRGAVLCHLSIILREKNIPAVVCPEIDRLASQGDEVSLIGGRVIVSHRKQGRKIIVEGTCCTGKTTIINILRKTGAYDIIDENISVSDYPVRDISSMESSLERDLYFLGMDMSKWKFISQKTQTGCVLVERCSLGTLSITYSSNEYSSNLPSMCSALLEKLQCGEVPIPDAFVYITKRRELLEKHFLEDERSARISHWNSVDAFVRQDAFLRDYYTHQTAVPVLFVENEGAEQTVAEIEEFTKAISADSARPDRELFYRELREFLLRYI